MPEENEKFSTIVVPEAAIAKGIMKILFGSFYNQGDLPHGDEGADSKIFMTGNVHANIITCSHLACFLPRPPQYMYTHPRLA